ncbi:MAG: flagellar biosynthetic protein FliQ [Bryobacteraceae bacterium]|nr:flagellar biosynthetic protein FliQ [Bryobacteraceae bacterium]
MTPEAAIQLIREALIAAVWIAGPILLVAFVIGLIINIVQIVTSLQDSAFSTIPRLAAFLVGFIFLMPWMVNRLMTYTIALFGDLARHAR